MNPLLCQLSYAAVLGQAILIQHRSTSKGLPTAVQRGYDGALRRGKRPGAMQGLAVNRVRSERKQP
jgi:hypothetical protein